MSFKPSQYLIILAIPVLLFASGCQAKVPSTSATNPAATTNTGAAVSTSTQILATATPAPTPTATPEPLALRINNDSITVAEYQAELRQLQEAQQALNKTATPEQQRQQVLDNLADTLLLAQGAYENGFTLDDAALQAEIDRLAGQLGGAETLKQWMDQRGYNEAAFRSALKRQMAAAWQRDQITASVPTEAEQIHARQILTIDEGIANTALQQVKIPGASFMVYAYRYDLQTGGDLGWFPRGYLTQPEVEEAAFALQPGEISPVVKSQVGYHIIQVIAREASRQVSPDARRVLQHKALENWLKTRRETNQVEILLP